MRRCNRIKKAQKSRCDVARRSHVILREGGGSRKNKNINQPVYAFTLLELLIVLSLIAGFTTAAIMSWQTFIAQHQQRYQANQIISAFRYAKHQAILLNRSVKLCARLNVHQCGKNWSDGQLVIDDSDGRVLRAYSEFENGMEIALKSSLSRNSTIVFTDLGMTAGQNGTFYLTDHHAGNNAKRCNIIFNQAGRVYSTC